MFCLNLLWQTDKHLGRRGSGGERGLWLPLNQLLGNPVPRSPPRIRGLFWSWSSAQFQRHPETRILSFFFFPKMFSSVLVSCSITYTLLLLPIVLPAVGDPEGISHCVFSLVLPMPTFRMCKVVHHSHRPYMNYLGCHSCRSYAELVILVLLNYLIHQILISCWLPARGTEPCEHLSPCAPAAQLRAFLLTAATFWGALNTRSVPNSSRCVKTGSPAQEGAAAVSHVKALGTPLCQRAVSCSLCHSGERFLLLFLLVNFVSVLYIIAYYFWQQVVTPELFFLLCEFIFTGVSSRLPSAVIFGFFFFL